MTTAGGAIVSICRKVDLGGQAIYINSFEASLIRLRSNAAAFSVIQLSDDKASKVVAIVSTIVSPTSILEEHINSLLFGAVGNQKAWLSSNCATGFHFKLLVL